MSLTDRKRELFFVFVCLCFENDCLLHTFTFRVASAAATDTTYTLAKNSRNGIHRWRKTLRYILVIWQQNHFVCWFYFDFFSPNLSIEFSLNSVGVWIIVHVIWPIAFKNYGWTSSKLKECGVWYGRQQTERKQYHLKDPKKSLDLF